MADRRMAGRCGLRARGVARAVGVVAAVLLALGVVAAPGRAQAVPAGTASPQAAGPQAIVDYESSTPAYAGAPWFEPGQPYAQNFPDPAVVWDGTRYWASATSTGGPTLPVMWSSDLVTWTARDAYDPNTYNLDPYFNDAFPVPPSWSVGGAVQAPGKAQWAPGMTRIGGSWVAYTAWEISPGRRCISAARASSPAGPFVDSSAAPLVCDPDPAGSIDASAFIDASGQPWLTWKAEGGNGLPARIYSRALSADGLSFQAGSSPNLLLVSVLSWEGMVVENPSMLYSGGVYWLVYSGNAWDSSSYRMGQARCAGPAGPCQRSSTAPLIGNTATDLGPGGGSLIVDGAGRMRLAHHVWNAPFSAYPADPNCDAPGLCRTQGQRFLRIEGVLPVGGALTADPIGSLDIVSATPGRIDVGGWAIDPTTAAPIQVHLYVDGQFVALTAGGSRPDVAAAYPGFGAAHGYSTSLGVGPGAHTVCAYGIGVNESVNPLLGCRTVVVPNSSPLGSIDAIASGPGSIVASGWAIDPDAAQSLDIRVLVDGVATSAVADGDRPDVGAAYPGMGSAHGYVVNVAATPGNRQVCVVASNVGNGADATLGCRVVVVRAGNPFGSLDAAAPVIGGVAVVGWAIDPDSVGPIGVRLTVDGVETAATASATRTDVGAAFPLYGADHGFSVVVDASPGTHTVCAYAVNVGAGSSDSQIGCRTVSVSGAPFGSLDDVTAIDGTLTVHGWAIDPDTAGPIQVHLYVDGAIVVLLADQDRPDVGASFPVAGSAHGYSAAFDGPPGVHTVCAYGINVGVGWHSQIGCRTITSG